MGEQDGGATGPKQPPLNLGNLEVGVDRVVDHDTLALRAEGPNTIAERAKSHKKVLATRFRYCEFNGL